MNELLSDLMKWLNGVMRQARSFMGELSKNPVVVRFVEDSKSAAAAFFKSAAPLARGASDGLRRRAMAFKHWPGLVQFLTAIFVSVLVITVLCCAVVFQVADRWDRKAYLINIPGGYGSVQVAEILYDSGIIDSKYSFNLMVSFLGLESRIQAGVYRFSPSMGLGSIVWKLRSGEIVAPTLGRVTFPEGSSIYKMGTILLDDGVSDGEKFKDLVSDSIDADLIAKFPFLKDIATKSLEGYLFPDTYQVPQDVTVAALRDLMLSRFSSVVMPVWQKSSGDTTMSLHKVLTLASIIEKEAAVDEERAIISSVFHNRLRKGMQLGADPTIKYALSEFRKPTKKVFYIDLEVDSPYNTYKYLGLPPGPICNPGLASIVAAIYPAETDYLYFVARRDGTHIFSVTWQEHERAKALVRGR